MLKAAGFTIKGEHEAGPDTPLTIRLVPVTHQFVYGFGWNPSTQAMLRAMQVAGVIGKTVLDVGSGTGILAIAAAKLGGVVCAVDTDPDATELIAQNAAINKVSISPCESYAVVLANLGSAEWVSDHLPEPGQTLIATIPESKQAEVLAVARDCEHVGTEVVGDGDQRFACIILRRS